MLKHNLQLIYKIQYGRISLLFLFFCCCKVYSHVDNKNTDKDVPCTFDAYFPGIESVQKLFSFVEEEKINHWQAYW